MKNLVLAALVALITTVAGPAFAAETLTSAKVESFVSTMSEVKGLSDTMKTEGKNELMDAKIKALGSGEELSSYSRTVTVLKQEFPEDYKKLGKITKDKGFSSQEEWAAIGDSVMTAYVASKIDPQAKAGLEAAKAQLTPEMKAKMPPQAVAQMEQGIAMMKKLEGVPQANMDAIEPHKPAIEAFIKQASAEEKAKTSPAAGDE